MTVLYFINVGTSSTVVANGGPRCIINVIVVSLIRIKAGMVSVIILPSVSVPDLIDIIY